MRLMGATTVRNAADIVEAYVRHNLTVLDGIAIVDHGSYDGTSDILAALVREGLPLFVARDETPAFDQHMIMNRLVRHGFATSDADWIFPIDSDEFLKVGSRQVLEAFLGAIPPGRHLLMPWLTYVPRFDVGDDMPVVLRSARRLAEERHGLHQGCDRAQLRRLRAANMSPRATTGYSVPFHCRMGNTDVKCTAEIAAYAHVPVRSAPQFAAKMAEGWLVDRSPREPIAATSRFTGARRTSICARVARSRRRSSLRSRRTTALRRTAGFPRTPSSWSTIRSSPTSS